MELSLVLEFHVRLLSAAWARVSKLRTPWVASNRGRLELSGWNVVSGCY